ncbi:glycosyltransferase [Methylobacterium sp. GXF4]|uniref:glycosyltransferase n=1 Tax=Methylobacterium sp. GXF4 TaxID=1096546 RepID=UPI0002699A53|nr:glycosyltransferase [Methylobacterium sp. GXF4]EIZ81459.1 glycosyltransferase [Methylobacterium sp. GXF4]
MSQYPIRTDIAVKQQKTVEASPQHKRSEHHSNNDAKLTNYKIKLTADERKFVNYIIQLVDDQFYIDRYGDVRQEGINPTIHWLEHGIFEHRVLNPRVVVRIDPAPVLNNTFDWKKFKWKGRAVIVRTSPVNTSLMLEQMGNLSFDDEIFIENVLSVVDWKSYVLENSDVRASGIDPVLHWLRYGFDESRKTGGNIIVEGDEIEEVDTSGSWSLHQWKGRTVKVRDFENEVSTLLSQFKVAEEEDRIFVRFIVKNIDRNFYLRTNGDVRASHADPVIHFLGNGLQERRPLSPTLRVQLAADRGIAVGSNYKSFKWRGRSVVAFHRCDGILKFYNELDGFAPDDEDFASFVIENIDLEMYVSRYADVRNSGHDPVSHYLKHGVYEGRSIASNLVIKPCLLNRAEEVSSRVILWWRGNSYEIRRNIIPRHIVDQVAKQAGFEPSVFAAGANALPSMRVFDGPDLMDRDRVDVDALLGAFDGFSSIIVVVPYLLAGGAEKYASDLVSVFLKERGTEITVLVTEQGGQDQSWKQLSILQPIQKANVVFWKDICNSFDPVTTCARLLNALRPSLIVVINSRIGLDVVASYGRGLSQFSKIYCAYFSLGVRGLGVPYGVMFPRLTSPFATSLTDNNPMRETLDNRYALISKTACVLLPAQIKIAKRREFDRRIERRKRERIKDRGPKKWAWYSRIEAFKGTAILSALAKLRPNDHFDIYGPGADQIGLLGLDLLNITYKGVVSDISVMDFSQYEAFIFTSLFEGMPNTILEMSQHAIPIVSTDVGGLRDTFKDTSLMFVAMHENTESMAAKFDACLSAMIRLSEEAIIEMTDGAYNDVIERHSLSVYHENVKRSILHV